VRRRQGFGNLVKLALAGACLYAAVKWHGSTGASGDVVAFARAACIDEIEARFDVSNVSAYDVTRNSSGFVVRASVTLKKGAAAKVVCLTNPHGGVRNVSIDER
jgi:hypothetical protein